MIFTEESLTTDPSKLFDCAKSKACCLTELSYLSVFSEEDRDDTNSELLVLLLNIVVEDWRSYSDSGYGLLDACVAQTQLSVSFDNEYKSVVFLSLQQSLKERCSFLFICSNVTVNLKGCNTGRNQA